MRNEGDIIAIFSILILIVGLVMIFPAKVGILFDSTVYLISLTLAIFMVFFYLWLRIKNY
jgi:hypothetical protein